MEGGPKFQYKSISFALGTGNSFGLPAPSPAANALQVLSAVPVAKELLPTILPNVAKASVAPQTNGAAAAQPATQAGGKAVDFISLLSDESDVEAGPAPQGVRKPGSKEAPDPGTLEGGGNQEAAEPPSPGNVLGDFIPLPKAESTRKGRGTGASPAKGAVPGSADALAEEEEIRKLGQSPYWMSYVSRIDSPLLRLHQEVVEMCELVQPTPEEAEARKASVAAVTEVVLSIWPNARCEIFGSYATGLYVPTSDIDLVILDSGCTNVQAGLKALATALQKRSVASNIQVIGKARVPIVKFETVDFGNLAFDVSFDVANGPQAAVLVSEMTSSWPMMRPLILVLKLFLQQRELNEVYSGGIGSYALITLVAAFLQLHASRRGKGPGRGSGPRQQGGQQPAQAAVGTAGEAAAVGTGSGSGMVEPGLGALLVDFFRFYGRVLNMPEVGVSCAGGGQFFRKADKETPATGPAGLRGWLNPERTYLLAVEDPKDPDNDVCRNSFNIMRVKTAFEFAYQMLTAPSRRDESLLARILRLGPILASRPRPRVTHLRGLGYYAQPPAPGSAVAAREPEREQEQGQGREPKGEAAGRGAKRAALEEGEAPLEGVDDGAADGKPTTGKKKKRARPSSAGRDGADEDGEPDGSSAPRGKKARRASQAGTPRHEQLQGGTTKTPKQRGGTPKQRGGQGAGNSGAEGAGPAAGGAGPGKRRRDDSAAQPAAAEEGAPAQRQAKRARRNGDDQRRRQDERRPDSRNQHRGEPRDGGPGNGNGRGAPHHPHHQQPERRRPPALMQVVVTAAPPPQQAPQQAYNTSFHPGYAPPPGPQRGRQRDGRDGGGGNRQPHRRQPPPQQVEPYGGGYGGPGGYGGGGHDRGHAPYAGRPPPQHQQGSRQYPPPGQQQGGGQGGRPRAPLVVGSQGRNAYQHQQHQRTHVFFD